VAKNRKNQSAEIRFGPVLKVVLLCSLICGSAIGYVWQKNQIVRLGRQITECESRVKQVKADNKILSDQIAFLKNPVMIDQRAKSLKLGLAPAQPTQVVRLSDGPLPPEPENPRQLAQRPATNLTTSN
jgi:cell division protein FtsL